MFFRPAEEAEPFSGGAVQEEKLLDGFDRAVGYVSPDIPAGVCDAREGAVSKSADQFKLTITGRMVDCATPHQGVGAIAAAARQRGVEADLARNAAR